MFSNLIKQKMKHILVTGGCGYTGTLLTNDLLNLGHKEKIYAHL